MPRLRLSWTVSQTVEVPEDYSLQDVYNKCQEALDALLEDQGFQYDFEESEELDPDEDD